MTIKKKIVLNLSVLPSRADELRALNDAVTEHVCTWPIVTSDGLRPVPGNVRNLQATGWHIGYASQPVATEKKWWHTFWPARFAESFNDVRTLLDEAGNWSLDYHKGRKAPHYTGKYRVVLARRSRKPVTRGIPAYYGPTPSYAACVALLNHRGIEVIT